ncbi:MAG: TlyA family RNA methyltransferase [Candidatus Firestonebacteria bacterium]
MRLDKFLVEKSIFDTLSSASAAIMAGLIYVDDKKVTKSGYPVSSDVKIGYKNSTELYVSRGGIKLKEALEKFKISISGKIAIDIGSSTGGFVDCLLGYGANKVWAVDVGYGQLHWKLRNNPQVVVLEKTNARYLSCDKFLEKFDISTIDVSFISLEKILPVVKTILKKNGEVLALIKPQFEVDKGKAEGGVVKDEKLQKAVVNKIVDFAKTLGFEIIGTMPCSLLGPKGNREYFVYMIM